MKFYSDKLDKMFDTMEELLAAETPKKKKRDISTTVNPVEGSMSTTPEEPVVPSRKELAAEVECADEKVKQAYADYEAAKVKAEELSKKYLSEINEILEPAQKAVKEAEQKRYEAIRKFNDSYGAYQVTYTGARAADEMMKAISNINSRANKIFRDMFCIW